PAMFDTNGFFFGGIRTISSAAAGATITCQVRVWTYADGPSWQAVVAAGRTVSARLGQSDLFQVVLGARSNAAPSLTGLMPFQTFPVALDDSRFRPVPVPLTVKQTAGSLVLAWPPWRGAIWGGGAAFALQQNPDLSTTNWVTLTNAPLLTVSGSVI